ncbi:MAG: ATP-binding protein [Bacteroidota bacterium]|nr:ATP-binding protein [Bacteroidota bacterium]MDP4194221.1 ATP-binding protein [Bacteroidota bacterium]
MDDAINFISTTTTASPVILLVDDNESGLYVNSRTLRANGYNVIEAKSGRETLIKLKDKPDVIILDVNLPDISGFEICRMIKSDPETNSIPVIHLSATYKDDRSKAYGLDIGADAYLTQPIDPMVMFATIKAVLRIRNAEQRFQEMALEWKTTFDSIEDAICLVDNSGMIRRCNKAFCSISGLTKDFLLGSEFESCFKDIIDNKLENYSGQIEQIPKSGDKAEIQIGNKWYLIAKDQIMSDAKIEEKNSGFIFRMTDITRLKSAEDELKRSNKALEQFAYVASHDLQEPLRMVSNYSSLILKKYKEIFSIEVEKYFSFILEGTTRMQSLIKDLLNYSRTITKERNFTTIDLNKIIEIVKNNLSLLIKETDAKLTIDKLPEVYGDETQLIQLYQNLISNAIKFRSERKPEIKIGIRESSSTVPSNVYTSVCPIFYVNDNGIGIETEYFNRIFIIFQRLHEREKYPGTGIGLSICQKIVERHGGKIWVESEPGNGSTFYFTLSSK